MRWICGGCRTWLFGVSVCIFRLYFSLLCDGRHGRLIVVFVLVVG